MAHLFQQNSLIPGTILTQQGQLIGMISRRRFLERISAPYGLEIFSRRPLSSLYKVDKWVITDALKLSGNTLIVEAATLSLQRPDDLRYEPLIVEIAPDVYKLLDIHQLLLAQAAIHKMTSQLLTERTTSLVESQHILEQSNQELRNALHTLEVTQAELEREKKKAESANQAKSEFLANMSHELRTPLNSIIGFTQILSEEISFSNEHRQQISIIHHSGEHLLALINDILDMSKIEAGRLTLNEKEFDLHTLFHDVQDMFVGKITAKGLKCTLAMDKRVPRYIHGDESRLRQALINLIGNAVKFTEVGEVTCRVTMGLNAKTEHPPLIVEVEDTGLGIAPDEMKRLFKPFEQTTTGRHLRQGTGLGLAITQKFIELMGGQITVQSVVGTGTRFQFAIPIRSVSQPAVVVQDLEKQVVGIAPNQPSYRILIVDDQPDARLLLSHLLTPVGFAVKEASNGQEAVERWQIWQPHLIWMDIKMPVMTGYEATQRIRELEQARKRVGEWGRRGVGETKIIALTASVFQESRETLLASGFDDYVAKPFKRAIFWSRMEEHLGVELVYQPLSMPELTPYCQQETATQAALPAEDLAATLQKMPTEWRARLQQAACGLKGKQVTELLKEIPEEKAALATNLRILSESYQFRRIVELLDIA